MKKTRRIRRDLVQLLHGPYTPQPLKRGGRATCLFRDCDVVITSWSDGRISWPRCQRPRQGGGSGLLVDEELVRAIRCESSLAVQYWFGVGAETVWRWRQFFGVGRLNEGSKRIRVKLNREYGAELRGKKRSRAYAERCRKTAIRLNLGRYLTHGYHGPWWMPDQLALLGKLPDAELAARIGRTANAVRIKRTELGIASALDRRRGEHRNKVRCRLES
jgi:hypothetical protein